MNEIGEYLSGACCSATSHHNGGRQSLLGKRGIGDKGIADNPKFYVAKSDFSGIPISLVTAKKQHVEKGFGLNMHLDTVLATKIDFIENLLCLKL